MDLITVDAVHDDYQVRLIAVQELRWYDLLSSTRDVLALFSGTDVDRELDLLSGLQSVQERDSLGPRSPDYSLLLPVPQLFENPLPGIDL